ncbi:VOC family protein [Microbacterium sp. NPDC057659]|uniref:VOC family protein n=1 Tax=Microbacterium sp. NPDC057659 TaxID=3346198 RepID=UPI00366F188B
MTRTDSATPAGYSTVAPWVVTDDTGALLDFIGYAFDGEELARVVTEDGSIGHGEIRIGDTVVLAFDRRRDWPAMPSLLRIWVPDADAAFARAVERGASVVTALGDNAFGQRGGRVKDPLGNIWWITQQVETVPEEVMWQRLQQPTYAENMRYAQESLDAELSGSASSWSSAPVRQS